MSFANRSVVSGGTFNLADDETLSTNELIREIGKNLGKSIYIWKFGHTIILFLAKVGDSLHLPLTFCVNNCPTMKHTFSIEQKERLFSKAPKGHGKPAFITL